MEDNLKEYFGGVWKPDWAKFEHSGYQLIEKINDLKPESVLDIGCGYNQLKEKIPNLFDWIFSIKAWLNDLLFSYPLLSNK